ncbi:DUF11 domain-containing protein [Chloroflexia bacterium SDU3-3]|nr:DUF11 domain-containing protein [Chloroflexia bacterium SDU3-3]
MQARVMSWMTLFVGAVLIGVSLYAPAPATYAAPLHAVDTPTAEPPTPTPVPPTSTPVPPTSTPVPPTNTPEPPTAEPPTATPVPPTSTPRPSGGREADPTIHKSASVSTAQQGETFLYTLTATNEDERTANDVVVSDNLASEFELVGVTTSKGTASTSGSAITVDIGSLAPDEVVTIQITVRVRLDAPFGAAKNVAIISTSSTTDDPGNNTSEVTIVIVAASPVAGTATPVITTTATLEGTPTPMLEATPAVATPVATRTPPRALPRTGAGDSSPLLLLGLSLALIGAGSLVWRYAGKGR